MPNTHVFPGGVLDKHDTAVGWPRVIDTIDSKDYKRAATVPDDATDFERLSLVEHPSYRICAVRELFEETGVLLAATKKTQTRRPAASGPDPRHISCLDVNFAKSPSEWKQLQGFVHDDASKFIEVCREREWVPEVDKLRLWARWITPRTISRRYDTWFYLAVLSSSAIVSADETETSAAAWFTPSEAIELAKQRKISLPPPTSYTLQELDRMRSLKEVVEASKDRKVFAFLPTLVQNENRENVTALPGDPLYTPPIRPSSSSAVVEVMTIHRQTQRSGFWEAERSEPVQRSML